MCRAVKSVGISTFTSTKVAFIKLEEVLKELKEIANDTDFSDSAQTEIFIRNIQFIKTYYEKIERLLLNEYK